MRDRNRHNNVVSLRRCEGRERERQRETERDRETENKGWKVPSKTNPGGRNANN